MFNWIKKRRENKFRVIIKSEINTKIPTPNFTVDSSNYFKLSNKVDEWLKYSTKVKERLKDSYPQWDYIIDEEIAQIFISSFESVSVDISNEIKKYDFIEALFRWLEIIYNEINDLFKIEQILSNEKVNHSYNSFLKNYKTLKHSKLQENYNLIVELHKSLEQEFLKLKLYPNDDKIQQNLLHYLYKLSKEFYNLIQLISEVIKHNCQEFLSSLIYFVDAYLEAFFIWYAQSTAIPLAERNYNNVSNEIIERYENFVHKSISKLKETFSSFYFILQSKIEVKFEELEGMLEMVEVKHRNKKIERGILNNLGEALIVKGYKENDQSKIIKGAALFDKNVYSVKLILPVISKGKFMVHGISSLPFGESSYWTLSSGKNIAISPKNYIERVKNILSNGLRPSKRQDSPFMFHRAALAQCQEVWFYLISHENEATACQGLNPYGSVFVLFKLDEEFAVFESKPAYRGGYNEYFILTQTPIKGDFKVFVNYTSFRTVAPLYIPELKISMKVKDYNAEVENLLKKEGISYTRI